MKRLIIFSVLILASLPAFSWGWEHRFIDYIAQEHCTPATRAVLDRYLDVPLNNVAVWMDHFKVRAWADEDFSGAPEYTFHSLDHAVCVDENFRPLDFSNRPEGNGTAYRQYIICMDKLSGYKDMPDSAVVVNLKLLLHIIADVHCPGHILYSYDRNTPDMMGGGIARGYGIWQHKCDDGKVRTLHAILDATEGCHKEFNKNLELWRQYIDGRYWASRTEMIAGDMADYIEDAARRSKVVDTWLSPGEPVNLSAFYTEHSHESLLTYLHAAAAYRTAHILNTIFDPDYKTL